MSTKTIHEVRNEGGALIARFVSDDDEAGLVVRLTVANGQRCAFSEEDLVDVGSTEFVALFSAMGEFAKFFGIDAADFFTPDEPENE